MGPCVCFQNMTFRKELALPYIELATSTFKNGKKIYERVNSKISHYNIILIHLPQFRYHKLESKFSADYPDNISLCAFKR